MLHKNSEITRRHFLHAASECSHVPQVIAVDAAASVYSGFKNGTRYNPKGIRRTWTGSPPFLEDLPKVLLYIPLPLLKPDKARIILAIDYSSILGWNFCWTRLYRKRTQCISQRFSLLGKILIGFEPIYSNIVLLPAPLSFLWLYHSRLWLEKSYKKSCAYKKAAKELAVLHRFSYVKQNRPLFLHLFAEKRSSRLN